MGRIRRKCRQFIDPPKYLFSCVSTSGVASFLFGVYGNLTYQLQLWSDMVSGMYLNCLPFVLHLRRKNRGDRDEGELEGGGLGGLASS